MANARSLSDLLGARFLLGVGEAGFGPGMTYFVNRWIPRRSRATAMAVVLAAVPFSLVFGGPFCGWLLGFDNPLRIAPWRWLFLALAIATFLIALLVSVFSLREPDRVSWLTPQERDLLEAELSGAEPSSPPPPLGAILGDPRVWRRYCSPPGHV